MTKIKEASNSPIELLPPELISTILLSTIRLSRGPHIEMTTTYAQLVCRRWYEVVLNSPALWSTIYIGVDYRMAAVIARLERSKGAPLCIELDIPSNLLNTEILMHTLTHHARRWKSLDITLKEHDMRMVIKLMPMVLPTLISLTLRYSFDPIMRFRSLLSLNLDCPSLRYLTVIGPMIDWESWTHLSSIRYLTIDTHISRRRPHYHAVLDFSPMLVQCQQLLDWDFTSIPMHKIRSDDRQPLVISSLQQLRLRYVAPGLTQNIPPYSKFLAAYVFPNLTHLKIVGEGFVPIARENQEDIRIPSLTHLEVYELKDMNYLASHLLVFSPNIVDLRVISAQHHVSTLSPSSPFRSSSVCPKLAILVTEGLTIDTLYDIVSPRQETLRILMIHADDIDIDGFVGDQKQTLQWKLSKLRQWTDLETFED